LESQNKFKYKMDHNPKPLKMPVLFIGHGSPMNAIEENQYTQAWKILSAKLPKPNAILSISAHWLTEGTLVHESNNPKTIHDFWGFPEALYQIRYPCPGAPELAKEVKSLVKRMQIASDTEWGIDHGTWVPLRYLFPKADVPIFQLSIDISKSTQFHYNLGKELAPLRKQGVLIIGSGNIVHNLGQMQYERDAKSFDWATEFDKLTENLIIKGKHESLISYELLGKSAMISVPTPDHYWPLLYPLGLIEKDDRIDFPVTGIAHGSVSMRAITIGM
jgi:4,5-DOPA dioxygenase extradiol